MSVANRGDVSWLKYPGDSNEGVLRSVKEVDGGAEASMSKSFGEMVPVGPSPMGSLGAMMPVGICWGESMESSKSAPNWSVEKSKRSGRSTESVRVAVSEDEGIADLP